MNDSAEQIPTATPEPKPRPARKLTTRKYIVVALVLLVGGIAASIYLIPSSTEVATMQAKDTQAVDLGQVDIEAEYTQGRRTFAIMSALADKRVAAGDRPAAIKLLEEYVAANAADVNGHKKLAEQYQLAGNQAGFNQQIELIAAAAPTEANLRMLSDIYNAAKEYPKQVEVLKKIVEVTKGENAQAYVDLATIQVVVGDSDGALKTVEELKAKHPAFSSYPMTRIMVSVLAEKGKVDEAFAAAKEWMDKTNAAVPAPNAAPALPPVAGTEPAAPIATAATADDKPKDLADLCNILHYSGHADKAVDLVELHLDMLDREPTLVLAYVNASITAGRTDNAYAVLKKIDDSGTMIAALYPPYIELTLKREDVASAEAIAAKLDAATFTEEQALNTIETARAHEAPTVLTILTSRFGDATLLTGKPVLAAVIAIITNDKAQDAKIETALNTQLTSTQRIRLAESCARASKTACFDAIVKQYPPLEQMSPVQVAEYAQLFIIADRAKEIVDPVGKLASAEHAAADVITAHRRLAAAAGRLDVLKPWLEANANSVPVAHLQELFYLANDRKHTDVSGDIAERLYARDPSPMNRDIMVSAYLGAGEYAKALPLLRDQMKDPNANDGLYLSTLSKVARKDASARKELAEYASAALQANKGDDRQKLNYVYILVNNGRKDEAIKYTKAYADQGGADWKKLYAQLTAKPKAGGKGIKLSREEMIAMANNPKVSAANKRQIAFNLLNDGHKADAMVVFKDLAKNAGPDSQEVKDLLFLWGGKLNKDQLAWVQQRAATASAYDKQRWGELVNQSADDNSLVAYVSATPDALYNPELRKKYFRVLAGTGSKQNYEVAMRNWVAQTTDVPAILDYASVAQNANFREAAINGYSRVLALDPNNSKALSQMAALDFSKGKYQEADQKLNHYIVTQQQKPDAETNPAQAHFYKAQLLRRQGKHAEANAEFAYVVQLASQSGASTPDALSRVYTSQFHMGQQAEAKRGFNQLLEQYPDDKGVLADYMSVLIEYNFLDEATRVANQYDKNSPYYGKGAALVGRSANTASVQQLSGGREMKITFSKPIEGKPPIDIAAAQKLAWVEHSDVSYDTVTVSAKPGYVVRYIPTANEEFAVVATPAPNYSPQVEAQRQQDLRLQLLYARIEQNSGQTEKAQQRLMALRQYYPQDPQLLSYEASVAQARGDNQQAKTLISQAQKSAPENEDLAYMAQEFSRPSGTSGGAARGTQYVKADAEYRNYGAHDETLMTVSGVLRIGSNAEAGFSWQHDEISPDQMLVPETGGTTNKDASRDQGELFMAYYLDSGNRVQASLFADDGSAVGGGGYYAFGNALGRTELLGEYHKPYWDYPQAVYANANRDRVGFRHFSTLTPKTTLGLEGSVNNYNIDFDDDQVKTILARASLTYQLQAQTKTQPYFGLGYGFDGEYKIDDHAVRTGVNGEYHPFDWRSREVHFFSGIYRDDWTPQTHALLVAGYAVDRLNEDGPAVEGRLTQDLSDQWELGARARYGLVTSNGGTSGDDNDAVNLGTHLMYKF